MTDTVVHIERREHVAVIRLNRPEARNAINVAMAQAIVDAVQACQDARAIVITGADPAFCAGLDLRNLGTENLKDLPGFLAAVQASTVPTIAAVNGAAVTGGFELALVCDFMIASPSARFADTHLRVGVYPGPVLVELPRRVGMARAREMSLTGNFVDAQTALSIGLVNHVVDHDVLVPYAIELATAISDQDPAMVRLMREDWDETGSMPIVDAHRRHLEIAMEFFGNATGEGIAARREEVIARARAQE